MLDCSHLVLILFLHQKKIFIKKGFFGKVLLIDIFQIIDTLYENLIPFLFSTSLTSITSNFLPIFP